MWLGHASQTQAAPTSLLCQQIGEFPSSLCPDLGREEGDEDNPELSLQEASLSCAVRDSSLRHFMSISLPKTIPPVITPGYKGYSEMELLTEPPPWLAYKGPSVVSKSLSHLLLVTLLFPADF